MQKFILFSIVFLSILVSYQDVNGQSFGRNKMRYQEFDFKVKSTPNFEIYHYLKNEDRIESIAQNLELWFKLHQAVFSDSFYQKNPFILYNNHADFQQTNTVSGNIGVGTGGVTELFKNRVVIPMAFTNQQTHHVIGHELVHAFQFNLITKGDSTNIQSLGNLPLWLVEGMAEYLSIGRVDPFTAMWMRDAVLNDDVPTLNKLNDFTYFPYRYGHVFLSFMTGIYGDQVIEPLFRNTAIYGIETGVFLTTGTEYKELSKKWVETIKSHYAPYLEGKKEKPIGKKMISSENAGETNISPAVSPNGKYLAFFSEKELFTTDLYLADAKTGEIIKKLSSQLKDSDIENYNFMESAGTWSPNSKKFAFVAFRQGKNILVIKDIETGKTSDTYEFKDLPAFTNPVWSPDGKLMVLTGLDNGQTDLYSFTFRGKKLEKLTNDPYSEIHASFTPDGTKLVFSSDKNSMTQGRTHGKWTFNLAVMDMESKAVSYLNLFPGADNLNPVFDSNNNLYFLSDRDGFRNLYSYNVNTGEVSQKTSFLTGISGITSYSPAISIAPLQGQLFYTHYYGKQYNIYKTSLEVLENIPLDPSATDYTAAILPVNLAPESDVVNPNMAKKDLVAKLSRDLLKDDKYRPKFKLDYYGGSAGVGVSNMTVGNYAGMMGGLELLFGDMLGNHQLFTQLALNGDIYDFGGQVTYLNREKRFAWGVGLSHIPYSTGYREIYYNHPLQLDNGQTILTNKVSTNLIRIFDEGVNVFAHYPFSPNLRLEGGVSGGFRSFRYDLINEYYDAWSYAYIGQEKSRQPLADTLVFSSYFSLIKGFSSGINVALVGDNSYNGFTSPLKGYRYRISAEQYFGTDQYTGLLADFRYYHWLKPVSLAFRGMVYNRFNQEVNSVYPIYIAQMGFVRGYYSPFFSIDVAEENGIYFEQMLGSKVLLGNFELRFPFSGMRRMSAITSRFLYSDIALFFDAGVAFDEYSHLNSGELIITGYDNGLPVTEYLKPALVMSTGLAVRINLMGALIVEPYVAWPLQKESRFVFGFNLMPGF